MRIPILLLSLAAASPAAAQGTPFEIEALRAQQQAADRRAIDQSNQLMALEARQRADSAALDAQIRAGPVRAPELRYEPAVTPGAATKASKYPAIPDAALADSNRRVRDAANPRHKD